ncbi:YdeI/OmpD-associated family protein [Streptomyces sp. KLOTTS4A1]|uniref:YdeI/OmpD-associated family protein n=1 Tax=Streptomyces sp. KLOTTS4A1 TaxID=3390996 RepID=UPI0039F54323
METYDDGVEVIVPASAGELEAWLEECHTERTALWVKIAKKHTGIPSLTWEELVEQVLCFGWIDGQRRSYDATYYLQKVTPRRPRSIWSEINVGKAQALIDAGRMRPRGLAEVEAARTDGRWEAAYASPKNAEPPAELIAALDANPAARALFDSLGRSDRYAVLHRLITARTEKTRQARIERMVATMAEGRKVNEPARKAGGAARKSDEPARKGDGPAGKGNGPAGKRDGPLGKEGRSGPEAEG